ncbi:MAG: RagB/SusD family nutrient uptake outer membrane protein [Leeuwenhoekiella sp.]
MNKSLKHIATIALILGLSSCEAFLEPIDENRVPIEFVASDPATAEGLILDAYRRVLNQYQFTETATSDAVHNNLTNNLKRMATGQLSAQFNPVSEWGQYERVLYINQFIQIANANTAQWSRDEVTNALFKDRLLGEALALRALFHFYVLRAHAGVGSSGELLGVPYLKEVIEPTGDFNLARLSYEETVLAIMEDFDRAMELLPFDYSNDASDIEPKFGDVDPAKYLTVNGSQNTLRLTARIVKALKARVAIHAASPSFLNGAGYYEMAANLSSELLNDKGGISFLDPNGVAFYDSDDDKDLDELLWRGSIGRSTAQEENNFPPSQNGDGDVNPTHNLVSAFPMKSGFPATEENGYDPQNPYADRDPRLDEYIVTNNSMYLGETIVTGIGGGLDRVDSIPNISTLTGYYMKKLLHPGVRINNDGSTTDRDKFEVYYRYTELFLILAEAANEIGGPMNQVNGISAMAVISAIRERAGIDQPDLYLESITSKEDMRELIRNERRLELSFEGHRFFDIRRWGLPLNETATGYLFNGDSYELLPVVEIRDYPSFAIYLPIPNSETIKFSNLMQNQGW